MLSKVIPFVAAALVVLFPMGSVPADVIGCSPQTPASVICLSGEVRGAGGLDRIRVRVPVIVVQALVTPLGKKRLGNFTNRYRARVQASLELESQ